MCITGCYNNPTDRDGEAGNAAGDDIPSVDELLAISSKGTSKGYQNSKDTSQHLETRVPNTSGSYLDPYQSKSDDSVRNSQGTRGMRGGSHHYAQIAKQSSNYA